MKTKLAELIASRANDGQTIGLGSGSTAEIVLDALAERVKRDQLRLRGVPTSLRTAALAARAGIQVCSLNDALTLDWAFDGADEVDPDLNLIKGRGAAMLAEKLNARRAKQFVVAVSESKLVHRLGEKFPVPVEVVRDGAEHVAEALRALGATEVLLREGGNKYGPLITENGNLVLDARFDLIPADLETNIKLIVGVLESGIFTNSCDEVIVAKEAGIMTLTRANGRTVEGEIAS
jgi:ribose 5-phosphate isomerase A